MAVSRLIFAQWLSEISLFLWNGSSQFSSQGSTIIQPNLYAPYLLFSQGTSWHHLSTDTGHFDNVSRHLIWQQKSYPNKTLPQSGSPWVVGLRTKPFCLHGNFFGALQSFNIHLANKVDSSLHVIVLIVSWVSGLHQLVCTQISMFFSKLIKGVFYVLFIKHLFFQAPCQTFTSF